MNFALKRTIFIAFMGVALFFVVFLWIAGADERDDRLRVNEIAFSMDSGIDWIEIYNPSNRSVSLQGMFLSDDPDELDRFQIAEPLALGPHDFIVIYCNEYEGDLTDTTMTNFRLKMGETVYLTDVDGVTVLDSMYALTDNDSEDATLGRYPDGGDEMFIMVNYTPGEANEQGVELDPSRYVVPLYDEVFGFD